MGVVVVAALAVPAVLLLADGPTAPEPRRPVVPAPEGAGDPDPVEGSLEVGVVDLSWADHRLFGPSMPENEPLGVDQQAVDALADEIRKRLDAHLSALQLGEDGMAAIGRLEGDPARLRLADDRHAVDEAAYRVAVSTRGEPVWARAVVEVTLEDGQQRRGQLVFAAADDGPRLVAAEGDGPLAQEEAPEPADGAAEEERE